MFLGALDQTIIATALPAIAGSRWRTFLPRLGGYAVSPRTTVAARYIAAWETLRRKRMLLWALGLFVLGSAACAIAQTLPC